MQKGNIYEARQALIYLCHIMKKDLSLSIKNGPVKETKSKQSKKGKKAKKSEWFAVYYVDKEFDKKAFNKYQR